MSGCFLSFLCICCIYFIKDIRVLLSCQGLSKTRIRYLVENCEFLLFYFFFNMEMLKQTRQLMNQDGKTRRMVSVVFHMLSFLEFTFKASFACPYAHIHFCYNGEFTNCTEPVGLVQDLKQQNGCVVLCSSVNPWAFIVFAPCCAGCGVQYGTAVVCTCIGGRVFP